MLTAGLDLATRIIKAAVKDIKVTHPTVTTFSTLSPVSNNIINSYFVFVKSI